MLFEGDQALDSSRAAPQTRRLEAGQSVSTLRNRIDAFAIHSSGRSEQPSFRGDAQVACDGVQAQTGEGTLDICESDV